MKLNLGCGRDIKEGYVNVDIIAFDGVDVVLNLLDRWPWEDDSVDEIKASHIIEHFDGIERCFIWNEMYRVMKLGAKATIIVPHWGSGRAYGDPTHKWPPVCEMAFYYLSKEWREAQAPAVNEHLNCDFEATWGYALNPALFTRNVEYQQFAVQHYREAAWDIEATLTKR